MRLNKMERVLTAAKIFTDAFPWLEGSGPNPLKEKFERETIKAFIILLDANSAYVRTITKKRGLGRRIKE